MREIDLVPREHIAQRLLRRRLQWAAIVGAALLVGLLAARLTLQAAIARQRPVVEQLQRELREAQALRTVRTELQAREAEMQAQWTAVQSRSGPSGWQASLRSLDRAFGPGLWLDQLNFSLSPAVPSGAAATPAQPPTAAAAWQVQRTLEIRGHALNHAGVMGFINKLGEQAPLREVRLVDTSLRRYADAEVVDFTVSAQVDILAAETTP